MPGQVVSGRAALGLSKRRRPWRVWVARLGMMGFCDSGRTKGVDRAEEPTAL
jgi:hypothetical protein